MKHFENNIKKLVCSAFLCLALLSNSINKAYEYLLSTIALTAAELKHFTKSYIITVNDDEFLPTECMFISFVCHRIRTILN